MKRQVLFIQGAGEGAYAEDKKLSNNLQQLLGSIYDVHFPKMKNEEEADYATWIEQITRELKSLGDDVILVGHSIGASVLIKFLSEQKVASSVAGTFLVASPFWGGENGWKYDGFETLELPSKAKSILPVDMPLFFYHSSDDEIVPFDHLSLFAKEFPKATIRKMKTGGHQLDNDLTEVANDIKQLG